MVFSSLFFIYAFLPLSLLAYAFCRSLKAKNICLLIFSLVFYTWGEPKYILLLMTMSAFDWFFALQIEKTDKKETKRRKTYLTLACIVNIGLIGFFKYGKLFASIFGEPPAFIANIALPLGISFYTFQLLSYVIDVYRGEAPAQKEYWHVLLFAALFHQCIAGPIVRYKDIAKELFVDRDSFTDMPEGCVRFTVGLTKKVILANACGAVADSLLLSESTLSDMACFASNVEILSKTSVVGLWAGLFVSVIQVYFDFSAYSDMAIGMGKMIGIHYPENFNYPYLATSAGEYWRRWHMTLGQWFRDYLYYPVTLGPAMKVRKFFTKKINRKTGVFMQTLFSMIVMWSATGLWHGASWSYVLWGLYWCVFMMLEQTVFSKWLDKVPAFVGRLYVMLILIFSRIVFRFGNVKYSLVVLKGLFGANSNLFINFTDSTILKNNVFILIFCIIATTPLIRDAALWVKGKLESVKVGMPLAYTLTYVVVPISLLLLSTAALVGTSYNPFLYYRF